MKKRIFTPVLMTFLLSFFIGSAAQTGIPAFPGAEGFGSFATGGRGGDVYIVTNLNDDGPGSFREAVEAEGPRTIVFAVSGTIELQSRLRVSNGDVTIAGQTAPGDGICLKNYSFSFGSENIIVRYLRFRLGEDKRWENDAVNGSGNNAIMDHCSISWGVDETASVYSVSNFTMQWCIISESLYNSFHSEGPHGMGGIWGGQSASFHHNLLAHHHNRLPRYNGSRNTNAPELEIIDHRNNVIYNWVTSSCYGAEGGYYNLVNNFYKPGPATYSSVRRRIIAPRDYNGLWGNFYVNGNYVDGYPAVNEDNWLGVDEVPPDLVANVKLDQPVDVVDITTQTPAEAYRDVLNHAGASLPKRDRVDARVTEETRTGTARYGNSFPGIIDHPEDVGGYPALQSAPPPADTDEDGIPDEWEDANGLDKTDPQDGKIIGTDGYSNLESYLNSIVGDFKYILRPMSFRVSEMDFENKNISLVWTDISDDEENFILERSVNDGEFVQIAVLDPGTQSYLDDDPEVFGKYIYRIKTIGQDMESCYATVIANLEDPIPDEYNLTVNINGSGNVYLNPDGDVFVEGTSVGLMAEPVEGWEFDEWTGDLGGSWPNASITMDADKTVTANFIQINVGTEKIELNDRIRLFPVPAVDETCLHILLEKEASLEVKIFTMDGRLVKIIPVRKYSQGQHTLQINISDIEPGTYLFRIQTNIDVNNKLMVKRN